VECRLWRGRGREESGKKSRSCEPDEKGVVWQKCRFVGNLAQFCAGGLSGGEAVSKQVSGKFTRGFFILFWGFVLFYFFVCYWGMNSGPTP
jgi:hypothetical protein